MTTSEITPSQAPGYLTDEQAHFWAMGWNSHEEALRDAGDGEVRAMSDCTLQHKIVFRHAYDKRSDTPSKNYGIHGMEIAFFVIGPKGAIQWVIYTNWHVRSAREHLKVFPRSSFEDRTAHRPEGYRLGYHAREAQYEGQEPLTDECELIGGKCFYDGSGLQAALPIEGFLSGGEAWLWPKLEAEYRYQFEGGEWPFTDEATEARAHGEFV